MKVEEEGLIFNYEIYKPMIQKFLRCNSSESKNNGNRSAGSVMKTITLFFFATFVLIACGGGSSSKAGASGKALFEISDGVEWRQHDICAVIFIGYGNNFVLSSQTGNYAAFSKRFPSLRKTTKFTAETEGDEIYYIIPRYSDATVIINEYKIDFENDMKEIIGKNLYDGDAMPLLIRCNISDLHPNTTVTVTGNGKSVTFNPMNVSEERNDVQFISQDNESTGEAIREGFSSEYSYKGISASINAKVINGNVSVTYDLEEATSIFGEQEFMLEDKYIVEGMSGACKGIFIGDVGQDYNPVLCCLMEDGGIEVIELYEALRNYDFSTSGRLRGHDNIVSVSNEGVHFGDGGGYATLFTLDVSGNKKEVEFNALLNGTWIHQVQDGDQLVRYIVYLSSDWKITYVCGFADSEALESFLGTCRIIEEKDNFIVYEYEMKEGDRSEMTGEAPDPEVKKGIFKVQKISDDWFDGINITCLTGLSFHSGGLREKAAFINKYRIDSAVSGN